MLFERAFTAAPQLGKVYDPSLPDFALRVISGFGLRRGDFGAGDRRSRGVENAADDAAGGFLRPQQAGEQGEEQE